MKKNPFTLFLISLFTTILFVAGCAKYTQIVYTAPATPNFKTDNSFYVYEDSTLKIVYYFWAQGGVMSFEIYNKLPIPLYIDWKKSSYIANNVKNNYYAEKETMSSKSVSATYLFNRPADWYNVFSPITATVAIGGAIVTKEERISFVPPTSWLPSQHEFIIMSNAHFSLKGATEKDTKVKSTAYSAAYTRKEYTNETDSANSPILFRNFITYSTKENFEKEYYLNNVFYVMKCITFKQHDYEYDATEYKDGRRFYITDIDKDDLFPSNY